MYQIGLPYFYSFLVITYIRVLRDPRRKKKRTTPIVRIIVWSRRGLNPRPTAYEAGASDQLSYGTIHMIKEIEGLHQFGDINPYLPY